MSLPPKAQSVTQEGAPDGYISPLAYTPQILDGGHTRLMVSAPPEQLERVHRALVQALAPPLKFLYVLQVERGGRGQLPRPEHYVAVELSQLKVLRALQDYRALAYHDGRAQIWIRSRLNEQIVLEETGVIYIYPDDLLFRDALDGLGVPEQPHESMADRDYVRVNFVAGADREQMQLMHALGLVRWQG